MSRLSAVQVEFLGNGYRLWRLPLLTMFFNAWFGTDKTAAQIRAAINNRHFTSGRKPGFETGTLLAYTREQVEFIAEGYRRMTVESLTEAFNARFGTAKTPTQIKASTGRYRLHSGRSGCFRKGDKPWNNGTKGMGLTGANRGSFKTGNIPHSHLPVGSEVMSADGYMRVKVGEPNSWRQKHILEWEQKNGSVPEGKILRFIDGNHENCSPDNLELITRKEHCRLNKLRLNSYPYELQPTIRCIAKLQMKTGELKSKPRAGAQP